MSEVISVTTWQFEERTVASGELLLVSRSSQLSPNLSLNQTAHPQGSR